MTKTKTLRPLSPKGLRTYSLRSRPSRIEVGSFGRVCDPQAPFSAFLDSLPDILSGADFKEFVARLKTARAGAKPILMAAGAHVIKVGLSPILIDLMEGGWVQGLALNGAGMIHDFEIAFCGRTSEDVASQLKGGRFGMARETGEHLNRAVSRGAAGGIGLGEAVGRMIAASGFPHKKLSLLAACARLGIPATVHVAIGTDFIHFHPGASGEALGGTTLRDFFLFCSSVANLEGGGVFINIGSAVILPEVFLKALTFVRNKGRVVETFTAAVFDFIRQYRPSQNVIQRTVGKKGRGFYFVGSHEIMIPLLAAGLKS